ncbi:MAG: YybH family protein [Gemmatimonadales bacterium]
MNRIRLALLGAVALAACAPPPTPPPDVKAITAAIDAVNKKNGELAMKGDWAGFSQAYESDALMMISNMPVVKGAADIAKTFGEAFKDLAFTDPKFTTTDVVVAGDYAIESGAYSWSLTMKKGKPAPDKGKYLTVWHKQADGSWKIARDISNTDMPAAPAK